jgi:hypothetical protein
MLGGIVGVCLLLAYVYHKATGGNLKQDLGWALPPAPALVSTGTPGRVFPASKSGLVTTGPPQAAGNGEKRWDAVFYEKRIPSILEECSIFVFGQNDYDDKTGGLIATWYPISLVSKPGGGFGCFAPPGPVTIATRSPEREWTKKNSDVLSGPKPLGIGFVRKIMGGPELEEIAGKYSKYTGDKIKGPSGSFWRWTLTSQTDIYRFKNRAGYLKITYDGRGLSTKIEDGTAKND